MRVTTHQLEGSFFTRLNPLDTLPAHFDAGAYEADTFVEKATPSKTTDTTPRLSASRYWEYRGLEKLMARLALRREIRSGIDDVSYKVTFSEPTLSIPL